MKPSPAFQFYPHDFLVGTADLTAEEVGGYIRLLCYQWAKGSLPDDNKKLSQLSGITDGLSLGNVSVKFRLCDDGMRRNNRLESVRIEQEEYRKKQAENGSKGGNPNFKTGKHNPYYNPKDNRPHNPKINSSPSSSPSSSTITSKEIEQLHTEKPKALTDEEFLAALKDSPAYKHINVPVELSKMDAWLLLNPRRQKTRKFVVAWLNRIEAPLSSNGEKKQSVGDAWDVFLKKREQKKLNETTN